MRKIVPCLWFDTQAEEAAAFYASVFENAKVGKSTHYTKASSEVAKMPEGSVLTTDFEIEGHPFLALNGGPIFKFSEAVSFMIYCDTQEEIDYFWEKLTEGGGQPSECGWLKDRFGLSWQVVPSNMDEMMHTKDKESYERLHAAFMGMKKLDMKALNAAFKGE